MVCVSGHKTMPATFAVSGRKTLAAFPTWMCRKALPATYPSDSRKTLVSVSASRCRKTLEIFYTFDMFVSETGRCGRTIFMS